MPPSARGCLRSKGFVVTGQAGVALTRYGGVAGYFTRNLATTAQWSEALLLMTS